MTSIYPILFMDLLRQASYRNAILLGMTHKQMVYFTKKYSKCNRIVLEIYMVRISILVHAKKILLR